MAEITEAQAGELGLLLEENRILRLMARFDDAVIRNDEAAFRSMWVANGIWEIGQFNPNHSSDISPLRAENIEEIVTALKKFNELNEFFFRTTLRGVITLNGNKATVRSPTTEFARRKDGHGYNNVAIYEDELNLEDGEWKFKSRRYYYIWVDSRSPISGSAVALPPKPGQS